MAEADARAALQRLIEERREDYAGLSRLIGRNAAYIQQYVKRGTPKRLAEEDRRLLARYFGVAEAMLGGPEERPAAERRREAPVTVPQYDLGASAGPGALPEDERARSHLAFDAKWLRRLAGDPKQLSMIRVEGDSMLPTLSDGDEILVDRGDGAGRLRDGIYVLRMEGALIVKRLALNPAARRIAVRSDNPAYPSWNDCDPADVDVIGRVIWVGRRVG
jgi:phage repressor protein C with HTH and peptisase S24 domain